MDRPAQGDRADHLRRGRLRGPALGAGASGFLLKDTPPAAIIDAVRRVADGDPMLSPSVTARLFAKLDVANRVQIAICVHDAGLV